MGQQIARHNAWPLATNSRRQSNAGMVMSLSISGAIDYHSLSLFCLKPFGAHDALLVVIGCM
jgi:hypothetical protein